MDQSAAYLSGFAVGANDAWFLWGMLVGALIMLGVVMGLGRLIR